MIAIHRFVFQWIVWRDNWWVGRMAVIYNLVSEEMGFVVDWFEWGVTRSVDGVASGLLEVDNFYTVGSGK